MELLHLSSPVGCCATLLPEDSSLVASMLRLRQARCWSVLAEAGRALKTSGTNCCALLPMAMLATSGCGAIEYQELSGPTMGTGYRILASCPETLDQDAIETELARIERIFSSYDGGSTAERFNQMEPDSWFDVEPELVEVTAIADRVSELSGGAFDVTVAPLLELYGFGRTDVLAMPAGDDVAAALSNVNFLALEYRENPPALRKMQPLRVDFGGIAKGHGVDAVMDKLAYWQCEDALVDVGGDLRIRGTAQFNRSWKVGIEAPNGSGEIVLTVPLAGSAAVATSGNYRNLRQLDGKWIGHVIDPRSGHPVSHDLRSVTVLRGTAVEADALATAILVLGPKKGLELAERQGVAAILIVGTPQHEGWDVVTSSAAEPYVVGSG